MRYMLDTNIVSYALRDAHRVANALAHHAHAGLLLSAVVLAEGRAGAYRSSRHEHWIEGWTRLTAGWEVVPFDEQCADTYGRIRADLEGRGTMIGHRDCQIAASALAYVQRHHQPVTVVTDNVDEFRRIPGLKVANWAKR